MSDVCQICRKAVGDNRRQADSRLIDDLRTINEGYAEVTLCQDCALQISREELPRKVLAYMEPIEKMANRSGFHMWRMQSVADAFAGIHRYLQAEMISALIAVLKIIAARADDPRYVDDRNKYAYRLIYDMIRAVGCRI